MLLHQAVQRGLFRAVTLVVKRSAIRRPLGLPANGLHARLPKWLARTVSSRELRLNRSEYCPPVDDRRCATSFGCPGVYTTSSFETTSSGSRKSLMGRFRLA